MAADFVKQQLLPEEEEVKESEQASAKVINETPSPEPISGDKKVEQKKEEKKAEKVVEKLIEKEPQKKPVESKKEEKKEPENMESSTLPITELITELDSLDQGLGAKLESFNKHKEEVAKSKEAATCLDYILGKQPMSRSQPSKPAYEPPVKKYSPERYKGFTEEEPNEDLQQDLASEDILGQHSRWSKEGSIANKYKKEPDVPQRKGYQYEKPTAPSSKVPYSYTGSSQQPTTDKYKRKY